MFPADRNAIVGIKPTVGLTSTLGVIPESPSMDTVGPFCRSVEDATIVLDIIQERPTASDAPDKSPISAPKDGPNRVSYTSWLSKKDALKGARFGVP
jgi:amidase